MKKNHLYVGRVQHKPLAYADNPQQDFIAGAMSLPEQVRIMRAGGLPPVMRELSDGVYDEDDSRVVDPSIEPGTDRFTRSEKIAALISERVRNRKKQKLEEAQT